MNMDLDQIRSQLDAFAARESVPEAEYDAVRQLVARLAEHDTDAADSYRTVLTAKTPALFPEPTADDLARRAGQHGDVARYTGNITPQVVRRVLEIFFESMGVSIDSLDHKFVGTVDSLVAEKEMQRDGGMPVRGEGYYLASISEHNFPPSWNPSSNYRLLSYKVDGVLYPLAILYEGISPAGEGVTVNYRDVIVDANIPPIPKRDPLSDQLRKALWTYDRFFPGTVRHSPAIQLISREDDALPVLPVFDGVYPPAGPHVKNLLDVAMPELRALHRRKPGMRVLVLGTGAGIEAVTIARELGISVDAVDINQTAVSNTLASAVYTGTRDLVRAWVSDGFARVTGRYDAVIFNSPVPDSRTDPNRFDPSGKLLTRILHQVPEHFTEDGVFYLMNISDISPYMPPSLKTTSKSEFKEGPGEKGDTFAIHRIVASQTQQLQRRLAERMRDHPEMYVEGACRANAYNFILDHIPNAERGDVNVLYIRRLDDKALSPGAALYSQTRWKWHVVVESGGRIYDFDYKGRPGTSIDRYVEEMFGRPDEELMVFSVPAYFFIGIGHDFPLNSYFESQKDEGRKLSDYVEESTARSGALAEYDDIEPREEVRKRFGVLVDANYLGGAEAANLAGYVIESPFDADHYARILSWQFRHMSDVLIRDREEIEFSIRATGEARVDRLSLTHAVSRSLRLLGFRGRVKFRISDGRGIRETITIPPLPEVSEKIQPLLPVLEAVAARTGRGINALAREAEENLEYVELGNAEYLAQAASALIGLPKWQYPLDDEFIRVRDGLSFLRLLGLSWDEIDSKISNGAKSAYEGLSLVRYGDGSERPPITFGYPYGTHLASYLRPDLHITTTDTFSRAMDIKPGEVVLDPMAGSGEEVVALAEARPDIFIHAFELNPENLIRARGFAKAKVVDPSKLKFHFHDSAYRFPLEDNSVDVVFLNRWSTYGFDRDQLRDFYSEVLRVLRPGGRLWVDGVGYRNSRLEVEGLQTLEREIHPDALFSAMGVQGFESPRPISLRGELAREEIIFAFEVGKTPKVARNGDEEPLAHIIRRFPRRNRDTIKQLIRLFGEDVVRRVYVNDNAGFRMAVGTARPVSQYRKLLDRYAGSNSIGVDLLRELFEEDPRNFNGLLYHIESREKVFNVFVETFGIESVRKAMKSRGFYFTWALGQERDKVQYEEVLLYLLRPEVFGEDLVREKFETNPDSFSSAVIDITKNRSGFDALLEFELVGLEVLREMFRNDPDHFARVVKEVSVNPDGFVSAYRALSQTTLQRSLRETMIRLPGYLASVLIEYHRGKDDLTGYVGEDGTINLNRILEDTGGGLHFRNWETASFNASRGLINAVAVDPRHVSVGYPDKAGPETAERRFPSHRIDDGFHLNPGVLRVMFSDPNTVSLHGDTVYFPYDPYKYSLPPRGGNDERAVLRRAMQVEEGRKVVIAISPSKEELNTVIKAYAEFGSGKRPLLIIAPRTPLENFKNDYGVNDVSVLVRNEDTEGISGFGQNDIVVLNTHGEVLKFLGASDLAIVGNDRNLFEPVSQGVPSLYFPGEWSANQTALKMISASGAGVPVRRLRLHDQMVEALENPDDMIAGAVRAVETFNQEIIPAMRLIASLAIGMNVMRMWKARRGAATPPRRGEVLTPKFLSPDPAGLLAEGVDPEEVFRRQSEAIARVTGRRLRVEGRATRVEGKRSLVASRSSLVTHRPSTVGASGLPDPLSLRAKRPPKYVAGPRLPTGGQAPLAESNPGVTSGSPSATTASADRRVTGHESRVTVAKAIEIAKRSKGLARVAAYLEALDDQRRLLLYSRATYESRVTSHELQAGARHDAPLSQVYMKLIRAGKGEMVKALQQMKSKLTQEQRIILTAAADMNDCGVLLAVADAVVARTPGHQDTRAPGHVFGVSGVSAQARPPALVGR